VREGTLPSMGGNENQGNNEGNEMTKRGETDLLRLTYLTLPDKSLKFLSLVLLGMVFVISLLNFDDRTNVTAKMWLVVCSIMCPLLCQFAPGLFFRSLNKELED